MKATYLLPLLLFFSAPFLAQAKVGVGVSYPDVLISPPSDTLQVVRVYNTGDEAILIDPVWNQTGGTLTAVSVTHNVTLTPGNSVPIFLKLKDSRSGNITGIVQIHPAPRNNTVSGGVGGTVTPSFDVKVYAKVLTQAEWNILHPPKVDDTTPIIDDQLVILIGSIALVVAISALLVLRHLKKREEHDETPTCPPTSV